MHQGAGYLLIVHCRADWKVFAPLHWNQQTFLRIYKANKKVESVLLVQSDCMLYNPSETDEPQSSPMCHIDVLLCLSFFIDFCVQLCAVLSCAADLCNSFKFRLTCKQFLEHGQAPTRSNGYLCIFTSGSPSHTHTHTVNSFTIFLTSDLPDVRHYL